MNFSLPGFALKHPVSVMMVSLTMLGLGVIAWYRLPLTFLPRAEAPFMLVIFPYPGAVPEQVEQQIAVPVEGEFRTIPGLTRIETNSHSNGCTVEMLFGVEANMTTVTGEIRDRIERLKLVLPKEVDRVQMKFQHRFRTGHGHRYVQSRRPRGICQSGPQGGGTAPAAPARCAVVEVHSPSAPGKCLLNLNRTARSLYCPDGYYPAHSGRQYQSFLGDLTDKSTRYYVRYEGEYRNVRTLRALWSV